MKDWNSAIRLAYMSLLNSIGGGVKVFYGMAPDTQSSGDKYIVISTITSVENSDKNSFDGNVSVLLDIIALGNSVLNVADSESMVTSVKALINKENNPDLSPDFYCVSTEMTSDEQLNVITSTKTVLRRLIRFEHFIGQIT